MPKAKIIGLLALLCLCGPALAQDDVIEGDIPAGPPFDGTVDRASMFDLEQIASKTYDAFAGQASTAEDIETLVRAALAEQGYDGTIVTVTTDFETPDRTCATRNRVETRIRYSPALDAVEVVAAAGLWVAAIAYQPDESDQLIETPAQDCTAG